LKKRKRDTQVEILLVEMLLRRAGWKHLCAHGECSFERRTHVLGAKNGASAVFSTRNESVASTMW